VENQEDTRRSNITGAAQNTGGVLLVNNQKFTVNGQKSVTYVHVVAFMTTVLTVFNYFIHLTAEMSGSKPSMGAKPTSRCNRRFIDPERPLRRSSRLSKLHDQPN